MSTHVGHDLKLWPEFFEDVYYGRKTFEVRRHNRSFKLGDHLILREWDPNLGDFTGRWTAVEVTYMLDSLVPGIEVGYCVLGIRPLPDDIYE